MEVEDAIRGRRTFKDFGPEPLTREELLDLLDLARFAPNHRLTQPWRFRPLGPQSLGRLKELAGAEEAAKLDRAPTLVLVTCVLSGDPVQDDEDLAAVSAAVYAVLLAAHARGLAGYWRTPAVLRSGPGRQAVGLPTGERVVGLLYLGPPGRARPTREREPLERFVTFLP